jgi:hypothetical protein
MKIFKSFLTNLIFYLSEYSGTNLIEGISLGRKKEKKKIPPFRELSNTQKMLCAFNKEKNKN